MIQNKSNIWKDSLISLYISLNAYKPCIIPINVLIYCGIALIHFYIFTPEDLLSKYIVISRIFIYFSIYRVGVEIF